ncbi:hypothetical protein [Pseudovibrio sp. Tun.PSC04-5.I4]|uniref:hypothetical protein n=1 Tax=Pseudovibrio sp. Tun.PSC04-5.I4 TaxID=1798213 RepID=UPI0008870824|nr:hypothetical protein [Pseudovibrio sp. Tun.PSC04-5.I4]SDQ81970.1 hypothetical protein SAMN04515695_1523 [Pseudovibrio sp. Tun.PSC04-5.I4]
MSKFDLDPWQEELTTAEPFAVGYKKGTGEPVIYGSFLLGAALLGTGIVTGSPIPALASLPVFLSVYWHYPYIDKRPQLGAKEEGLYIERIGFIRWSAISELSIYTSAIRSMEFRQLRIQLNAPLKECIAKPAQRSMMRAFMRKNWRLKKEQVSAPVLEVDLHHLACDPEKLLERTKQFCRK